GQHRADFFGAREGLMNFHARTAGVGKNRIDALPLEAGNQNFAARHGGSEFALGFAPGCLSLDRFAHVCLFVLAGCGPWITKKPTTAASRGFLSKSLLT